MSLEEDIQDAKARYQRQRNNAMIMYRMPWQAQKLNDVLRLIDDEERTVISAFRSIEGQDEEKNASALGGTQKLGELKGRGPDFNAWAKGREPWNKGKKYTHRKNSNQDDNEGLTNNDDYRREDD